MILIADSGSTKCDWVYLSNDGTSKKFQTSGINPQVHSTHHIRKTIANCSEFEEIIHEDLEIYIYASGASTKEHEEIISEAIHLHFKSVKLLKVHNDLIGAARACLGDQSGLMAILGTGSNVAFYENGFLTSKTPALGYVLGDEGSGSNMGKKLFKAFFYNKLPKGIAEAFKTEFEIEKDSFLHKIYNEERPNAYLASATKFIAKHKNDETVNQIIEDSFQEFVDCHLLPYQKERINEINFVGSIPIYFENELSKILTINGFKIGKIVKSPIEALKEYHLNLQKQ